MQRKLVDNLAVIKDKLGYGISFDIFIREFKVAEKMQPLCLSMALLKIGKPLS